ncbi:hypothetical protein DM02DRAFT_334054 [Periconia macrospinosa]|uniref:Uncharacterized protein n=1 Tax=Periconia macrospinosa TaxID=97972 RepID=A0A2V1DX13_9PLEO|nr:hypothetical protein DM02DRAFT_334054 [Periconia macrospinosa]
MDGSHGNNGRAGQVRLVVTCGTKFGMDGTCTRRWHAQCGQLGWGLGAMRGGCEAEKAGLCHYGVDAERWGWLEGWTRWGGTVEAR